MAAPVIQFKRGLLANLPGLRAGEPGFTTDSYDLYVGIDSTTANNQFVGSGRYWTVNSATVGSGVNLVEGTDNGTSFITLKAPNSLSGIVTYTMPGTDGSNGHVLITDGNGGLSFSAPAASSFTLSADSGSNDNFNTGETLTFAGTANEIETTVSDNQIQIGLPNNVTVAGTLTATGGVSIGSTTILGFLDEDNMASDSASHLATQQSIKAYVDSSVAGVGVTIGLAADSGSNDTYTTEEVLTFAGGEGIDTTVSDNTITIAAEDATDSNKGVASFDNGDFSVSSGNVTLADSASGAVLAINGTNAEVNVSRSNGTVTVGLPDDVTIAGILTVTTSIDVNGTDHDINGAIALDHVTVSGIVTAASVTANGGVSIGSTTILGFLDEDNMASDSASHVPTQQSVKAYVDSQVTAQDLDFAGGSGTGAVDLDSQTLTIAGTANEIETSASGQTLTVGLPAAVTVTTSLTTPTVQASAVKANDGTAAITITDSTGAVELAQNLTIGGNLYVNGSTTQVNTSTTTIEDQLLDLGFVDGSAPSSDLNKDIGVLFNYYTSSAKKAAVYWDDSTSRIVVSQDVSESSGVLTNNTGGALEVASLYVNGCSGTTDQVIGCDGNTIVITNATIDGGAF